MARQSVFSLRRWVGAAAWPRRSSGTKAAPSRRRASMPRPPTARPPMRMAPCRSRQALAGEGREEFALAVAGDAGDADDFAGAHRQLDVLQSALPCSAAAGAATDPSTRSASAPRAGGRCARTSPTSLPTMRAAISRALALARIEASRRPGRRAGSWRAGKAAAPPRACARCRGSRSPRRRAARASRTGAPPPAASARRSARRGSAASGSAAGSGRSRCAGARLRRASTPPGPAPARGHSRG